MAHNIMNNNAFVSVGQPAWHKLGITVDKAMTAEEAIRLGKLDYDVLQTKVMYETKQGLLGVDNRVVNYNGNTGKPFGVVSNDYKLVQNREAFGFFDAIIGDGDAVFQTAGALKEGQIAFVTAKLPDYIRVAGTDDVTERYLLLSIGHDGKHSTQAMFTPIRVVCNNTLSAALTGSSNKVTVYHRGDTKSQLDQAHKVLGISNRLTQELSSIFTVMSKTKISDEDAIKTINRQFVTYDELIKIQTGMKTSEVLSTRKINMLKDIRKYYYTGAGQDMETCKGTVFGMYNAVNGYFSNKKTKNQDKKVTSLYFGNEAKIIDSMFKVSVGMI